jgi:hypothetical protein
MEKCVDEYGSEKRTMMYRREILPGEHRKRA